MHQAPACVSRKQVSFHDRDIIRIQALYGPTRNMTSVCAGAKTRTVDVFVQKKLRALAHKGADQAQMVVVSMEQAAVVGVNVVEHHLDAALAAERQYHRKQQADFAADNFALQRGGVETL